MAVGEDGIEKEETKEEASLFEESEQAPMVFEEKSDEKPKSSFSLATFFSTENGIRTVYLFVGFVVIGLVFYKLQYSTQSICCGDYDGYYHIRWSRLLWENFKSGHIFPPTFTWLPLTTLNPNDYVDHHYLFHLLQIPFTWFFELTTAAKVSAILFSTLALFSCYWLIVRYQINYALLWLLALLTCSAPFLYRMSMAKAPPLAIIFLVIGTYLLFEGKYKWLAPLMFLFVWAYSLWVLMLFGVAAWFIVMIWSEERVEWRPAVYAVVGTIAGFIINPYFPKNIKLFVAHALMKASISSDVAVGQEWYPYDSWYLLTSCVVAFIAMTVGYVCFRRLDKKLSARSLYFLILSTVLMIATFHSRRFVEYWPPIAVLFAAFSIQAMLAAIKVVLPSKLPDEFMRDLSPYLDHPGAAEIDKREQQKQSILFASAIALSVVLLGFLVWSIVINGKEINDMPKAETYQKGMEWIRTNVPAGQIVFSTDWDDFPKMFFYDTTHPYVTGLDPTYLHQQNKELSELYVNITLGKIEDPGLIIRDRFKAQYVFSDNSHDDFYANAIESGWFDKVYEDGDCFILKLRDQKGEPPTETIEDDQMPPDDANDNDNDTGDEESDEEPTPTPK